MKRSTISHKWSFICLIMSVFLAVPSIQAAQMSGEDDGSQKESMMLQMMRMMQEMQTQMQELQKDNKNLKDELVRSAKGGF